MNLEKPPINSMLLDYKAKESISSSVKVQNSQVLLWEHTHFKSHAVSIDSWPLGNGVQFLVVSTDKKKTLIGSAWSTTIARLRFVPLACAFCTRQRSPAFQLICNVARVGQFPADKTPVTQFLTTHPSSLQITSLTKTSFQRLSATFIPHVRSL